MEKFLYLTKVEWQEAWIRGGEIPVNLASTYLSAVRSGIQTPDETLIHDSSVDLTKIPGVHLENVRNITFRNCTFDGLRISSLVDASIYKDDGLILSFCSEKSAKIAARLGKICCVRIRDMHALKRAIDAQLGAIGQMAPCRYTSDHQRSHFLKSEADSWQKEYRLFWPGNANRTVNLPVGIADPVEL